MELKFFFVDTSKVLASRSNRTFMELKYALRYTR